LKEKFMKKVLCFLLTALMLATFLYAGGGGQRSTAETWPTRPITLTVSSGAGGTNDLGARILAPFLEKEFGVTVNVANQGAGGGLVIWQETLRMQPDGYNLITLLMPQIFTTYNPELNNPMRITDFEMLANAVTDSNCLYTNVGHPVQTLQQFIQHVRTNRNVLIGVTIMGGDDHLAYMKFIEALASRYPEIRTNVEPVYFISATETITAQLGGFTDFMILNVGDLVGTGGGMNVICVFSEQRSELLPEIPTFAEVARPLGITVNALSAVHRGYVMPKGGDPALVRRITEGFMRAMSDPEYIRRMQEVRLERNAIAGAEYQRLIEQEMRAFRDLLPLLGWAR
jgi:tripartite-type tricarboxylate transporter receptor subunit TctC